MNPLLRSVLALVLSLAVCSCLSFRVPEADIESPCEYDIRLTEASVPAEVRGMCGAGRTGQPDSAGIRRSVYEDELVRVYWMPTDMGLAFRLENKTGDSLRILWSGADYVDESGVRDVATHGGLRYEDYFYNDKRWQRPSVVPARGSVTDWVLPLRRLSRAGGFLAGTGEVMPWFPEDPEKYQGKTIRVTLPMQSGETVVEYRFVFGIVGVAGAAETRGSLGAPSVM